MTLKELQRAVLGLEVKDRIALVQWVLSSIQQEMTPRIVPTISEQHPTNPLSEFHPWTRSLIGVIPVEDESMDAYVDYLAEKYR